MTNGLTIEGQPVEEYLPQSFTGNIASNWKGTEILYVQGEGYKIIIDMGTYTYVLDLPNDYTLEDISNFSSETAKTEEAKAKEAGVQIVSLDSFNSGFLNNDTLINVPAGILSLEGDIYEIASNFLEAVETNRSRVTSTLLNDEEYVSLLNAEYIASNGDMNVAIANLAKTDAYGSILYRLGVTQAQIDGERKEFTDRLGFEKDKEAYIDLFNITAADTWGGELPSHVTEYLAEMTAKGIYTQSEALAQIGKIFDPASKTVLDAGVLGVLEGETIKQTSKGEDTITDLLNKYLPAHLQGEFDIAAEAGKLRNIADYSTTLENKLKEMRFNFYPMYDKEIAWQSIVSAKKESAMGTLGVTLKDDDPLLMDLITLNDYGKEQELLRKTGLERGYTKTKNDLTKAMMATFGSGIIRDQQYAEVR
tara:strand:+ start:55 stop:1317 length:1263 start_codon:yes stop_codon:yes gene_type:complete